MGDLATRLRAYVKGTEGNTTLMWSVAAPIMREAADELSALREWAEAMTRCGFPAIEKQARAMLSHPQPTSLRKTQRTAPESDNG